MKEVAQRFEAEYLKDAAGLNCKKPTVQPRATEHIPRFSISSRISIDPATPMLPRTAMSTSG